MARFYDPPSYCYLKPLSRYAEAVRTLRMGVQMADVDNPAKVVHGDLVGAAGEQVDHRAQPRLFGGQSGLAHRGY